MFAILPLNKKLEHIVGNFNKKNVWWIILSSLILAIILIGIVAFFSGDGHIMHLNEGETMFLYGKRKDYNDHDLSQPILHGIYIQEETTYKDNKQRLRKYGFLELGNNCFAQQKDGEKTEYTPKKASKTSIHNMQTRRYWFYFKILLLILNLLVIIFTIHFNHSK